MPSPLAAPLIGHVTAPLTGRAVAAMPAAMPAAPEDGPCGPGISGVACRAIKDVTDPVGQGAKHMSQSVLGQIADALKDAAETLLKNLMTFWMNIDTPRLVQDDPKPRGVGPPLTAVQLIQNQIGWLVTTIAVVCIVIAAAHLVIRQKGEPLQAVALGVGRLVLVCAAGTWVIQELGQISDAVSKDLLDRAHIGDATWSRFIDLDNVVKDLAEVKGAESGGAAAVGLMLVLALLVLLASLVQALLMVLRVGVLTILVGVLPLSAAAAIHGEWGSSMWKKHLAWLFAWLLYKPAAALLMAGAFALTHEKSATAELAGVMLLLLSVLLMPALLRLIVPATAALGGASGGPMAMAATAAVATGAIKVGTAAAGGAFGGGAGAATTGKATKGGGAPGPSGTQQPVPDPTPKPTGEPTGGQAGEPAGKQPGNTTKQPGPTPGQTDGPASGADNPDSATTQPMAVIGAGRATGSRAGAGAGRSAGSPPGAGGVPAGARDSDAGGHRPATPTGSGAPSSAPASTPQGSSSPPAPSGTAPPAGTPTGRTGGSRPGPSGASGAGWGQR